MARQHETQGTAKGGTAKGTPEKAASRGVSIRIIGAIVTVIAVILAFYAFSVAGYVSDAKDAADEDEARYVECSAAIDDLQRASDYLTSQARMFVVTGSRANMLNYVSELSEADRRGEAVRVLKANIEDGMLSAAKLESALDASNDLADKELTALRLAADYYRIGGVPDEIADVELSDELAALNPADAIAVARDLVLGGDYDEAKAVITENVAASSEALLDELNREVEANDDLTEGLLIQLRIAVALLLCDVLVLVLAVLMYVLRPLDRYIKLIGKDEPLEEDGCYELHYLANAYNAMYEDNGQRIEQLRALAERDPLTGISNRSGYDNFLAKHTHDIALLLIDIDNLKEFNKVYGRDTGDAVMIKLARALSTAFRSTDFPCRIGGDIFGVVMTSMGPDQRSAVEDKVALVNTLMADDSDDLPFVTLSVGVAFSAPGMDDADIYEAANAALQQVRHSGHNGLAFYEGR